MPDQVQARCPAKLRYWENALSAFGSPILLPLTGSTLLGVDFIGSINRGRFQPRSQCLTWSPFLSGREGSRKHNARPPRSADNARHPQSVVGAMFVRRAFGAAPWARRRTSSNTGGRVAYNGPLGRLANWGAGTPQAQTWSNRADNRRMARRTC